MRITPGRWIVAVNTYRQLWDRSHVRGGIRLLNLRSVCVSYLFYSSPFASNLVPTNLTLNLRRLLSPRCYCETWLVFRAQWNTVKGMNWECPVCLGMADLNCVWAARAQGSPAILPNARRGILLPHISFWAGIPTNPLPSSKENSRMLRGPERSPSSHGLLENGQTHFQGLKQSGMILHETSRCSECWHDVLRKWPQFVSVANQPCCYKSVPPLSFTCVWL